MACSRSRTRLRGLSERQTSAAPMPVDTHVSRGVRFRRAVTRRRTSEARLAGAPSRVASTAAAYHGILARFDLLEITCHRWFRRCNRDLVAHERFRVNPEDTDPRPAGRAS
jgi:hypothetical protein